MNGPNTRGLLGKGLSAPVTPAVFGPFMPGTCITTKEELTAKGRITVESLTMGN